MMRNSQGRLPDRYSINVLVEVCDSEGRAYMEPMTVWLSRDELKKLIKDMLAEPDE